ncbi:MAG: FAD-dependent oxidoreductase [Actinobacteria bacterium]|nr:FAD-dependent oxidoreductase [Actinomycetota bacterium]
MQKLRVIGASWCPDCKRSKTFLGQHRIAYDWVDMENNPEAIAEVEHLNGGKRSIPTIIFPDGSILVEPTNDELADKLNIARSADNDFYDLVIAGGGPASLTTAIYAARENLKVLIVEKSSVGGQAGVTERFDNYPGFPDGIGGADLADRFTQQARKYGVEILQAVRVENFTSNEMGIDVLTSTNQLIQARALMLATGSTYRRTDAIGEDELIGAGIHFCATCYGPFYKGAEELVVLGGGNSGLEEGLFLTQFADHVTVIERGRSLKGSKLLQEKVLNHEKMSVKFNLGVKEFTSTEGGKKTFEHAADGAFVFIGLDPNTKWLPAGIDLDERGFIKTDQMFRTSLAGVFAAGDVRAGSTKQLASAVGEGAATAIQIRYYLDSLS